MRRPPRTPSLPCRLRARVPLAVGVALLALLTVGAARLVTTAVATTAGATAVSLVADGGALFSAAALSPGQVQTACVGLTASGSVDPATEVALTADVASGGLAPYLELWVEDGSVPAGGSCSDFSGALVWSGTLAGLPATGAAGIPTGWRPALTSHSVYRITVRVMDDPRAQNLQTSAAFRWSFTEASPPPIVPSPAPTTAAPAPRSTSPSGGPTTSAAAVPPAPSTGPTPASPVPVAKGPARAVVQAPPLESGPAAAVQAVLAAAGEAVQKVARTAVAVVHDGQYPVGLVAVVAAFLSLQGRLDRRDPKLALARVREELFEFREFPEPPPTETT